LRRGKDAHHLRLVEFNFSKLSSSGLSYLELGGKLPSRHPSRIIFSNLEAGNDVPVGERFCGLQLDPEINKSLPLVIAGELDSEMMYCLHRKLLINGEPG
jgi:hypothetical protein